MRRALLVAAGVALVVVVVIGLTQAGGGTEDSDATKFDLPAAKQKLAAAPAPLNALYAQANDLLGGGASAFSARLNELKGHPLVINKWASWCAPCQAEFSIFQFVATRRGRDVVFHGLNVTVTASQARGYVAKRRLQFP